MARSFSGDLQPDENNIVAVVFQMEARNDLVPTASDDSKRPEFNRVVVNDLD